MLLISALSRGAEVHLNLPVLLATIVIAVVTSFIAGAIPALRLSRIAPSLSLKAGGSTGTGRGQHRLRASFIVIQVALAMVLMVTAGLLLRLLSGLSNTDLGFETRGILAMDVNLPQGTYKDRDPRTAFYDPLLEKVRAMPGVQSAGVIQLLPIERRDGTVISRLSASLRRRPIKSDWRKTASSIPATSTQWASACSRADDRSEDRTPQSQQVAVVNEAFVKKFFSNGEDPIGKQIKQDTPQTIVGVVSSVRQDITSRPWPRSTIRFLSYPKRTPATCSPTCTSSCAALCLPTPGTEPEARIP